MKQRIFGLILIGLIYCFLEMSSLASLQILAKYKNVEYSPSIRHQLSSKSRHKLLSLIKNKTKYITCSRELGWSLIPGGTSDNKKYHANNDTIRSDKEFTLEPPAKKIRIATFGDSFVHGDNVILEETWQKKMLLENENLEVLNFGVGGYGLDQAYLRYLNDGARFNPHIVFIGYMPENIHRNVSVFRPFYIEDTSLPLSKPYFIINKNNELSLIPNPIQSIEEYRPLLKKPKQTLKKLGKNDFFYQTKYSQSILDFSPFVRLFKIFIHQLQPKIISNEYYNQKHDAYKITTKIFDQFYQSAQKNKSTPIILITPTENDVRRYKKTKTKMYQPLLDYFDEKNYQVIDLMGAFEKYDKNKRLYNYFINHYSPKATPFIAKYIIEELEKKNLI